jgi:hypothetical protein
MRESSRASNIQCSATFTYALLMNGSLACAARCLASSAFRRQSTLSDDIGESSLGSVSVPSDYFLRHVREFSADQSTPLAQQVGANRSPLLLRKHALRTGLLLAPRGLWPRLLSRYLSARSDQGERQIDERVPSHSRSFKSELANLLRKGIVSKRRGSLRPVEALDQEQESDGTSDQTRSGAGLG